MRIVYSAFKRPTCDCWIAVFSSCGTHLGVEHSVLRLVALDGWYVPGSIAVHRFWSGHWTPLGENGCFLAPLWRLAMQCLRPILIELLIGLHIRSSRWRVTSSAS